LVVTVIVAACVTKETARTAASRKKFRCRISRASLGNAALSGSKVTAKLLQEALEGQAGNFFIKKAAPDAGLAQRFYNQKKLSRDRSRKAPVLPIPANFAAFIEGPCYFFHVSGLPK
jgi:hypothetical protein